MFSVPDPCDVAIKTEKDEESVNVKCESDVVVKSERLEADPLTTSPTFVSVDTLEIKTEDIDLDCGCVGHSDESPATKALFKCGVCDTTFRTIRELRRHVSTHTSTHTELMPYECPLCETTFPEEGSFESHMTRHTGNKWHGCTVCPKKFYTLSGLKQHVQRHAVEKQHACEFCDEKFQFKNALKEHMLIHSNKKRLQCTLCNKTFSRINIHMRVHYAKKYTCDVCDRKFSGESFLNKHMVQHYGEKPYKCKACAEVFPRAWLLKQHMFVCKEALPYIYTNISAN